MNLDVLYEQHHTSLVRYLTRYTGDREEAADAAQEAFLRLVEHPPERDQNLRAWLFMVATNVVRDSWKKRRRAALLVDSLREGDTVEPSQDPQTQLEREERRRAARALLTKLSARDRMILLMREEGFAHKEIAAAVGTTTRSVGTMIARAVRKLSRDHGTTKERFQ